MVGGGWVKSYLRSRIARCMRSRCDGGVTLQSSLFSLFSLHITVSSVSQVGRTRPRTVSLVVFCVCCFGAGATLCQVGSAAPSFLESRPSIP